MLNLTTRMYEFRHPEIMKGEIFIGNRCKSEYEKLPYSKKRLGLVAIDPETGKSLQQDYFVEENVIFPVFVNKKEYDDYYGNTELKNIRD